MRRPKAISKTIGEVEKLTGIPKRKVKYYIERRLITPTQKSDSGYWLYSDKDIRDLRLISLCRELEYTDDQIRDLLAAPGICWQTELSRQIDRLRKKCARAENRLLIAEYMRYRSRAGDGEQEFLSAPDGAPGGPPPEPYDLLRLAEEAGRTASRSFYRAVMIGAAAPGLPPDREEWWNGGPGGPQVQTVIRVLCDLCGETDGLSPEEVLFALRLAGMSKGTGLLLDMLSDQEGTLSFLTEAAQIYCDRQSASKSKKEVIV